MKLLRKVGHHFFETRCIIFVRKHNAAHSQFVNVAKLVRLVARTSLNLLDAYGGTKNARLGLY